MKQMPMNLQGPSAGIVSPNAVQDALLQSAPAVQPAPQSTPSPSIGYVKTPPPTVRGVGPRGAYPTWRQRREEISARMAQQRAAMPTASERFAQPVAPPPQVQPAVPLAPSLEIASSIGLADRP